MYYPKQSRHLLYNDFQLCPISGQAIIILNGHYYLDLVAICELEKERNK